VGGEGKGEEVGEGKKWRKGRKGVASVGVSLQNRNDFSPAAMSIENKCKKHKRGGA
jgi:hypothetical protein